MIPAYNAAKSIGDAINSCIHQTIAPHEIIVIDDASTDDTAAIAKNFENVQVISLKNNSGPSAARNAGWAIATGDIIAFLDADDVWLPDKIETLANIFTANTHLQLLGHSYNIADNAVKTPEGHLTRKTYFNILISNPYQPSCMAVRCTLKMRFDETYRYCEDHEFAIRVAHRHPCYYLYIALTTLGRPQLSQGGASGNVWKMRKGELRLYTSIYKHNILYLPLIPFLWVFSLLKMSVRLLSS